MLAMWHRVLTRPLRTNDPSLEDSGHAQSVFAAIEKAETRLVLDECVLDYADSREFTNYSDVGCCLPVSKLCWVEFQQLNQYGVLFQTVPKDAKHQFPKNVESHFEDCHFTSAAMVFGSSNGDPTLLAIAVIYFDENGNCSGINASNDEDGINAALAEMAVSKALIGLSFAHCKNVELVDCTKEHGPDEKFCRRQKVPSVIYKTLKIPGITKRYADGGGHSGAEMRSHICRGHFATYTADKPLFGRPDGVGKFWHPAHVRGNAKHGAVVKDYEVVV